jgi:hypothetical protein
MRYFLMMLKHLIVLPWEVDIVDQSFVDFNQTFKNALLLVHQIRKLIHRTKHLVLDFDITSCSKSDKAQEKVENLHS